MKLCALIFLLILFFAACSNEINYLPAELYNYKLESKLEGNDAKNFVNKLHFNDVTEFENEIGFYTDGQKSLTIYITYYPSEDAAINDEKKMTEKISPQNSVFMAGKYVELSGKQIYECYGMGQAHYVFSKDNKLFWISVDSVTGQKFIKDYLNFVD